MILTSVNTNPFPGLRPFNEEENYLFFGRETQVDELINKLSTHRFLAVVGTSGSGKSSLVNCGLFPALHGGYMPKAGSRWRIAKFRPGNDPIREMALALAKPGILFPTARVGKLPLSAILTTNLQRSKLGLVETYKQARLPSDNNLLIVVDQFEELFRFQKLRTQGRENEDNAIAFVNLLLEAVKQSALPIYIVITMRSDFLGDCSRFRGLPEMINEGQYLVPRMKRKERKSAITGPIEVAGGKITDRLLMRLINDVGDNPDQLSILQHALNRTWAAWEQEKKPEQALDLRHYQEIGTMSEALDQHAERAYKELPSGRLKIVCQKIFKALTDVGTESRGIRRPTKLSALCAIAEASEDEVKEVIEIFRKPSRSFLMPPAGQALESDTIIDISHESFMRIWKRLIRWTNDEQESVRTYQRLSDAAMLYKEEKTSLLTEPYLQFALNWREEQNTNQPWAERYDDNFDEVLGYLRKSRREQQLKEAEEKAAIEAEYKRKEEEQKQKARRAKKINLIVGIAGGICFLLFIATLYFYNKADGSLQTAENARRESDSLKAEILRRMGFTDKSVSLNDIEQVFKVKDIQDTVKMIESGVINSSDAVLLSEYQKLMGDGNSKFLNEDSLLSIERKIGILESYEHAQQLSGAGDVTVSQHLKAWQKAASLRRNTDEFRAVNTKLKEYTDIVNKYANISNQDDIRFLMHEPTRDEITNPPLSQDTFNVGNGIPIYLWFNANDAPNNTVKLAFYSDGKKILYSDKTKSSFPTWTVQYFNPEQAEKPAEVRLYNGRGDLIGKKSFTLSP
ncbi:energy-coupling factor transporter ATP-binding protein EcfA2 [Catalinimonas alkaloidigena]|uniref:ATP-binding protein n=1 Tax=Catalinimonas alkaloidigena TaxID=1075417 RepID=UPI0024071C0F|nr:ATP-binding protein [Catalinimonas alkaloidigena]MDF9797281.1 energy-coupling factor transporter ATP-binding protein EcfA2 [Catalinimonas alkaloidigena]